MTLESMNDLIRNEEELEISGWNNEIHENLFQRSNSVFQEAIKEERLISRTADNKHPDSEVESNRNQEHDSDISLHGIDAVNSTVAHEDVSKATGKTVGHALLGSKSSTPLELVTTAKITYDDLMSNNDYFNMISISKQEERVSRGYCWSALSLDTEYLKPNFDIKMYDLMSSHEHMPHICQRHLRSLSTSPSIIWKNLSYYKRGLAPSPQKNYRFPDINGHKNRKETEMFPNVQHDKTKPQGPRWGIDNTRYKEKIKYRKSSFTEGDDSSIMKRSLSAVYDRLPPIKLKLLRDFVREAQHERIHAAIRYCRHDSDVALDCDEYHITDAKGHVDTSKIQSITTPCMT